MPAQLFYIESMQHGPADGAIVWWRPDWLGYTTSIREAGKYLHVDAKKIVQGAMGDERAWPVNVIESILSVQPLRVYADQGYRFPQSTALEYQRPGKK